MSGASALHDLHQMHHRGQVLAGTSVPPPQLDEFFLEQDAPRRADEEAALGFTS